MQPSPPQHQMPCSTDPLLGSSLPGDEGTAGGILLELGSAALVQSHWRSLASPEQTSAMHTPMLAHLLVILPDSGPPRPPRQRNKELPALFAHPVQAVVGKQYLPSQTLGQSGTWRRDKWDTKTSLPPPHRAVKAEVTGLAPSDHIMEPILSPLTQSCFSGGRLPCAPPHIEPRLLVSKGSCCVLLLRPFL